MKHQPILVIEHCEPRLSEWLFLEYRHAAKIWDNNVVFTNICDKRSADRLKKFGRVVKKNAGEFLNNKKCIVLDPQSKKTLKTEDFQNLQAIIIGGILGCEKPHGRTKKMISDRYSFKTRNMGKTQLTIDGAAFIAKAISLGLDLDDIEITYEVEIKHDKVHSTILPFGYPIVNSLPLLTPGLIEYLSKESNS
ncbi:MAG: hypothetical protein DRN16_04550 [Thermoplasmata archaeon]|nr:MAG: hypothetical protein DRN16_04550 [Thermoplasmata archaeon]